MYKAGNYGNLLLVKPESGLFSVFSPPPGLKPPACRDDLRSKVVAEVVGASESPRERALPQITHRPGKSRTHGDGAL